MLLLGLLGTLLAELTKADAETFFFYTSKQQRDAALVLETRSPVSPHRGQFVFFTKSNMTDSKLPLIPK